VSEYDTPRGFRIGEGTPDDPPIREGDSSRFGFS
jgi:hypothetical protein